MNDQEMLVGQGPPKGAVGPAAVPLGFIMEQMAAKGDTFLQMPFRDKSTNELMFHVTITRGPTAIEAQAAMVRLQEYLITSPQYQAALKEFGEKKIAVVSENAIDVKKVD